MTALTAQIARERRAMCEAWRSGFMAGCIVTVLILAPVVVLALMLGR